MASETLSRARLGVPLAACFAAVAALSFGVRNDSFVDAALPLYAAAIAAIAWLEGRRFGDATLAFAIPTLAVWRIGVPEENLRLLLYGITLAAAAALFALRAVVRGDRLRLGESLVLVASCLAPMRLVPWEAESLVPQFLVIVGTLVLVASLAEREEVGAGALLVCLAVGLATPMAPMKAALFPLLVTTLLAVLRGPSPFSVGALVGIAALAGRWAWPMAALTLASGLLAELVEPLIARRRQGAPTALGVVPLGPLAAGSGALAVLAWSPESALRLPFLARPARIAAVALAVTAFVLRPSLGALYLISALSIVLTDESRAVGRAEAHRGRTFAVPLVAIVVSVAMISLAGFSGAVVSRFPLPLALAELAAVAVVALAALPARRFPALSVVLSAIALLGVLVLARGDGRYRPLEARAVLVAGESYEVEVPAADELRVELSGGNLTGLEPGAPVGSLEAIDRDGRVVHRDLAVGDLADWGLGRPLHYFSARNEWPAATQAKVAEYGSQAFLGGSGTVKVAMPGIVRLRITASSTLPGRGRLNLESVSTVSR